MSAADLKSGVARLRFGSRNEALETALTDLLKRNLVTIDLKFDPPGVLKWVELRRPRDEAVMARLVIRDEAREELIDLHADFVQTLGRVGLTPQEGGGLLVLTEGGGTLVDEIMGALKVAASRPLAKPATEEPPQDPVSALWELLEKNAGSIVAPPDWASEHDHYLYGTPKRGDGGRQG